MFGEAFVLGWGEGHPLFLDIVMEVYVASLVGMVLVQHNVFSSLSLRVLVLLGAWPVVAFPIDVFFDVFR